MKPGIAMLFAGAVLLLVSNMMEADGQVSQLAELEKGELHGVANGPPEVEGSFTDPSDIGPDANTPVFDVPDEGLPARPAKTTDEIGDFGWGQVQAAPQQGKGPRDLQPGEVTDDFNPTVAVRD